MDCATSRLAGKDRTIAPARAYILCATPRSGSTLLCDLLAETGVAGRPDSFFRRESIPWYAEHFGLNAKDWPEAWTFDRAYLAAVRREGDGGTGHFGLRLMWESLADLTERLRAFYPDRSGDKALLEDAFGPAVYLHLSRADKLAQAISHLKAEQSGLWHRHADGTERERLKAAQAPAYDARAIGDLLIEAEGHDAAWEAWFAEQGIEPLRITYEALAKGPQAVLARLLSALGQDPKVAQDIAPRTAKLADDESQDWAARFRREQAD